MLNVVVFNGGRGAASIIPALLDRQGLHVTSVVNAYDDGKSTGDIRRLFSMLGPSDIRKVQELMLPADDVDHAASSSVFAFRYPADVRRDEALAALREFADGGRADVVGATFSRPALTAALRTFIGAFLEGLRDAEHMHGRELTLADCSIMNCIYAGAFLVHSRNIEHAALAIDRLFRLRGTVLPTSIENKKLVALRENGEVLHTEADIVELRSNVRIDRIFLLDEALDRDRFGSLRKQEKRRFLERNHCFVDVSPRVRLAVQQADLILYSAGTQHSSLYPTYLATGLASAIADNRAAVKIFVTNIGADYETPSYRASDYLKGAYRYLNLSDHRTYAYEELFDFVLVNSSRHKSDESYVEDDVAGFDGIDVERVVQPFESRSQLGKHDGVEVVRTALELYERRSLWAGSR